MKNYMIQDGTAFCDETDPKVRNILNNAIKNGEKLRIWYGDNETGRDWMEIHDIYGYIGRSTGEYKVPLLLRNSRSMGGPAILDEHIIKITKDKQVIYQKKNYHQPVLSIREGEMPNGKIGFLVFAGDDNLLKCCDTKKKAENEVAFHKGLRNIA